MPVKPTNRADFDQVKYMNNKNEKMVGSARGGAERDMSDRLQEIVKISSNPDTFPPLKDGWQDRIRFVPAKDGTPQ